ncbi:MAG: hypothetical protein ACJA09_004172, partial [Alcanivorax sp.]
GGSSVPIVGFAAWERSFAANAAASYGRLINHAYINANAVASGGLIMMPLPIFLDGASTP